jgi:hypothetical protein
MLVAMIGVPGSLDVERAMGIDIHAFNFIMLQAKKDRLGSVLTIGRQSLSLNKEFVESRLGTRVDSANGYCEPVLMALNASNVASIDYSDYESATYVADLNFPVRIESEFDTVIDSGSLEHVFDTASAFNNCIRFCKVGGRLIHILPVNNLNGHGFWQFSSDLMYSIYSKKNGFCDTEVYYASGLDFSTWYKAPQANPGKRVEIVSLEPVIMLSVSKKASKVDSISAVQPFYLKAWRDGEASSVQANQNRGGINAFLKNSLKKRGLLVNFGRNLFLILGLASGLSRFSIKNSHFKRVSVEEILRGPLR